MVLIKNASIFDGKNPVLKEHSSIVIEGNLVKEITKQTLNESNFEKVIDAQGKTVIPGLVDSHIHLFFVYAVDNMDKVTLDDVAVRETVFAKEVLMRGFTTVRDAGGCVLGLKKNIDSGFIPGPRIYPSMGAMSQTSGHSDIRSNRAELPDAYGNPTSPALKLGGFIIADGVPEILKVARTQLYLGASQLKIMACGGLLSTYDPLLGTEYTIEEMKAVVDVAKNHGTYVMAHAYTADSMKQAIKAGVMSLEHATLMDEDIAKMSKDKGIWISPMPQFPPMKDNIDHLPPNKLLIRNKLTEGEAKQTELINKYDLNIVYGIDMLRDERNLNGPKQLRDFGAFKRRFGSFKGLLSATGNANELIKMTTFLNPYPEGKIGVLEEGSFADLLIVNGNPVEDLDVLTDVDNIRLIMKDAVVYKNTL